MEEPPGQLPEAERAVIEGIRRESVLAIEFASGPGVLREEEHNLSLQSRWNCTLEAEYQCHKLA